ncbi:hypothetical protein CALVIDRAFT_89648 [Calocera viscosa TUFC12733]|uniref:Uncharacterized protein n=1 Tax=Calocera viscosa (strain TUFC12733) TaxID=1330018 RepID=A0A167MRV8_CALVF|nr:hypothetical protein CALVIDRAFT_89648 [Calocera viscosa TUFC12733]
MRGDAISWRSRKQLAARRADDSPSTAGTTGATATGDPNCAPQPRQYARFIYAVDFTARRMGRSPPAGIRFSKGFAASLEHERPSAEHRPASITIQRFPENQSDPHRAKRNAGQGLRSAVLKVTRRFLRSFLGRARVRSSSYIIPRFISIESGGVPYPSSFRPNTIPALVLWQLFTPE